MTGRRGLTSRGRVRRDLAVGLALAAGVALVAAASLTGTPPPMQETGAAAPGPGEWAAAAPDYPWSFPSDHGPHPRYKTEWWYFTGLLHRAQDGAGEPVLGYQFTVFKVGVVPGAPEGPSRWSAGSLLMGHLAVTDLVRGEHAFSEVVYRAAPLLAGFGDPGDTAIAWSRGPPGTEVGWRLAWANGEFELSGRDDAGGIGVDLTTRPTRPAVFHGPGGYSAKSAAEGRASMYYSYTRLDTKGSVTVGGTPVRVAGTSWMDHEFSSEPLSPDQVGWDWFSLRLDDGRDLMAFQLRRADGSPDFGHLTVVSADGETRYHSASHWTLTPGATWTSPETGTAYPVAWTLSVPEEGLELTIRSVVDAQENVSKRIDNLYYWEGAVTALAPAAIRVGEGYLEMTGYGAGSRPAL